MKEYEISNWAILGFVLVMFLALMVAIFSFSAGPDLPSWKGGSEQTQLELDMDSARAEIQAEQQALLRIGQKAYARYLVEKN